MSTPARIPLWVKMVYTGFVAVLVPIYWRDYTPVNFLYFCDVALLLTVPALWFENALLASASLVGILVAQTLWIIDFVCEAVGLHFTGLTGYMFDPRFALFTRMLSFFHFWLPLLLLWVVWRLGYDRRAFVWCTLVSWVLLGICYVAVPPPPRVSPNAPANINYVFGFSDKGKQEWMSDDWYFTLLMAAMPLLVYLPTHWLLGWLFTRKKPSPPGEGLAG
jgi:hypothetical protein